MVGEPANDGARAPAVREQLLDAALGYAARGWPVLPCGPTKLPLVAAKRDAEGKKIRGTGGVSVASADAAQIRNWWLKWPNAMVAIACGYQRLLVVDFDPRHDEATGEEWTLERLRSETEALIGGPLPPTLSVRTPSGGVHLYYRQDGGEPIGNKGSLPDHVDVRGLGGYVIAPPSVNKDGVAYRWLRGDSAAEIADAPAALLKVLREPKRRTPAAAEDGRVAASDRADSPGREVSASLRRSAGEGKPGSQEEAQRRYALAALDRICSEVQRAGSGSRNAALNTGAFQAAQFVAAGALSEAVARSAVMAAAQANPGRDTPAQLEATFDSGWSAGLAVPKDLGEVGTRVSPARRAAQPNRSGAGGGEDSAAFRSGRVVGHPTGQAEPETFSPSVEARLRLIAADWLTRRIDHAEATAKAVLAVAWGVGRRVAAGLIDEGEAKEALWALGEGIADLSHADVDQAIDDGFNRGFDPGADLLELKCSRYPMTDFGIAERFRDRFGEDFRFTTAQGWLGWDGRRWKVLDQEKDRPPAEVIAAVFDTVRAIQVEARRIRATGTKQMLLGKGKDQMLVDPDEPNPHGLDRWVAVGRGWKLFSDMLAAWGRQSETTGKPAAVAALACRWLTVPIERFDCEQMAVNVMNGTLRFTVEPLAEGGRKASVALEPHRREDLITRLAPVLWDPHAEAPIYDRMIAWAQPDPAVRRYVHQVGGYAVTGDTGAHLLWFNYGRGRNGKSTSIDSWCATLGDYSGTIGIESFLDQGIKKRGEAATPDLAKLGGVRMLRASEPERGAKLNSALIKAATGGEPMSVRALHRGFFDLQPRFKLLMSGNSKPSIPDTDEGIWGRMKLIPWLRHIEKPDEDPYRDKFPCANWPAKDPHLTDKIKAGELPGVFRRLIEGLCDYLEHGFVEPEGVTLATSDYRQQSDPLARFLLLCTERVHGERVKSSELHAVFAAWCKAAGEKEWSQKGFADAMIDKGFTKTRSDGMRWEGLRLTRAVDDFLDDNGNVKPDLPDLEAGRAAAPAASAAAEWPDDDDRP